MWTARTGSPDAYRLGGRAGAQHRLLGPGHEELVSGVLRKRRGLLQQIVQSPDSAGGLDSDRRKRGAALGRKQITMPPDFEALAGAWQQGEISARAAAERLGISHQTFLRRVKEFCAC